MYPSLFQSQSQGDPTNPIRPTQPQPHNVHIFGIRNKPSSPSTDDSYRRCRHRSLRSAFFEDKTNKRHAKQSNQEIHATNQRHRPGKAGRRLTGGETAFRHVPTTSDSGTDFTRTLSKVSIPSSRGDNGGDVL